MTNEIKKRLEIITLALSLEDIETINLQIIKLQYLELDYHVKSIIFLLDTHHYVDAQKHIDEYIASASTSIKEPDDYSTESILPSSDEISLASPEVEEAEEKRIIDKPIVKSHQDNGYNLNEIIPKDDYFDTITKNVMQNNDESDIDTTSPLYKNFKHLQNIYIPIVPIQHTSEKVKEWFHTLTSVNDTEEAIDTLLKESKVLEGTNKAEAAQLLLLAAATSSKHAKFSLARILYKGTLFEKDVDASFQIMSHLAYKEKYPEAICDLGQFYENGVSVDIDTLQAETLYKEAVDLGIQRAEKHYIRLQKESEGFFSFLKG